MKNRFFVFLLYLPTLIWPGMISAQENPIAFIGATIYPIEAAPIENGVLIIEDGIIMAVGGSRTRIPKGAVINDVSGKIILPGLVDTHSHIGEGDGGDRSSAMHPDVRIMDSFNPLSPSIKKALAGGITAANVMPGSGLLMSGQTIYIKLRATSDVQQMLMCVDKDKEVCGGLKMANGTNPIGSGNSPGTRAKSAALVRSLFIEAQDYQQKVIAAQNNATTMPARNLRLETLIEVLEGKRTVHHHTHRHDDVLTAIRLADEFGYDMVLQHVSEAYKVAGNIAASGYPSSIITLDSFGGKMEAKDFSNRNGAVLEAAGAAVGLHTDDYITDSRLFLRSAALAVREGMSREGALEAITLANAKMMRVDDRIGSFKKGKDADLVILSGDPFSVYTHVEQTWIEGQKVWDRANPEDKKVATGGYGVFRLNTHTHTHEGGQ
tara:strand:+ start:925 stop:2232 length:1308 start_codon:yes stop_codon:yes gene_type:complete